MFKEKVHANLCSKTVCCCSVKYKNSHFWRIFHSSCDIVSFNIFCRRNRLSLIILKVLGWLVNIAQRASAGHLYWWPFKNICILAKKIGNTLFYSIFCKERNRPVLKVRKNKGPGVVWVNVKCLQKSGKVSWCRIVRAGADFFPCYSRISMA